MVKTDEKGSRWLNDNVKCIIDGYDAWPSRIWVWAEPGVVLGNVPNVLMYSSDYKEYHPGCTLQEGTLMMIQNTKAAQCWTAGGEMIKPTRRARKWLKALHWYNPHYAKRIDSGFFGLGRVRGEDAAAHKRLETGCRLTGLLGIIPKGLGRVLRRPPPMMHESNMRGFNKRTERMLMVIRRTLILATTEIATDWIVNSNLWIRLFW
jgi:hypothetical protein